MNQKKLQHAFFFGLLTLVGALAILMSLPFLGTVVLAVTFGVVLHPIHKRLLTLFRGRASLAALATMLIGAILVLGPIVLFGWRILKESADLYANLSGGPNWVSHVVNDIVLSKLHQILPGLKVDVNDMLRQGVSWLAGNLGSLFTGTIGSLFHAFVFAIAVYYILRDGMKFKRALVHFSPLRDEYDNEIYGRLTKAMRSIMMGSLLVSAIQGLLAGIGLAIFGVPNATLWGSVAGIFSLVPGIGTSFVWLPAIFYVYSTDSPAMAAGLSFWAVAIVGLIDNILSPVLVGRGVHIHPFFVLMSVVSGLAFFGPAGFVFGPLLLSLLFALLDIYRLLVLKEKLKKSNSFAPDHEAR